MTEPITKEERAKYPWYDLEGALTDLQTQGADKICLNTIERAIGRLCGYEAALQAAEARIAKLEAALKTYANADIYKPHPHGPAFDDRDLSFIARAALGETDENAG